MKPNILKGLLEQLNGATFVGIDVVTKPTINKTMRDNTGSRVPNPHYDVVNKVVTGMNVMVTTNKSGSAYERMVRRRQAAEGKDVDFKAESRKWGVRVGNTPLIEHNDQLYLEVFCLSPGKVEYNIQGNAIDKADIIGLHDSSSSEESQGGIEDKVIIRTIKAESIMAMRIDGVEVKVR